MWQIIPGHSLVAIYGMAFLAPFATLYLVLRLAGWWRGL
ncbi:hypothetical protein MCACPph1_CDS0020 [Moorella phage MCACPph1]